MGRADRERPAAATRHCASFSSTQSPEGCGSAGIALAATVTATLVHVSDAQERPPCRNALPLAVADNLLLRLRLCAFPFATAWPVNAELAAPSVSKPSFGAIRSRYPAFRQSMSVWATKALAPSSTSARPADRPSTTSRRDRRSYLAILVGAFADPSFPTPTFPVYEERMHSWVGLPEGIEHMA